MITAIVKIMFQSDRLNCFKHNKFNIFTM